MTANVPAGAHRRNAWVRPDACKAAASWRHLGGDARGEASRRRVRRSQVRQTGRDQSDSISRAATSATPMAARPATIHSTSPPRGRD